MNQVIDPRRGCTSASNALYDSLCQARFLAQRGIPERAPSKDAEHGRKIHYALSLENPNFHPKMSVQERDIFDQCRAQESKLVETLFGPGKLRHAIRERSDGSNRLWAKVPDGKGGYFDHSGQPDFVVLDGYQALILEYKTLMGDVPEAPDNLQLRDQAVLLKGANPSLQSIGVAVVQPLVRKELPTICLYDAPALERAKREMFDRVRASNDPSSKAVAGKPQCDFCLAKTSCIAYHQWAGAMLPAMLSVLDVPVAAWSPEQRVTFLRNRSVAQKWLDTCLQEIETLVAHDPAAAPGWKLKPGAIREAISDAQKVFERWIAVGGKTEEFLNCISVTKGKLRDALHRVTGAKGNALEQAMDALCKDAVSKSQNKPSLVEDTEEAKPEGGK